METKSHVKPNGGMEIVLNGGRKEMDSATIPIQWFFGDEVIKRKPAWILIIEQNEQEYLSDLSDRNGRRYFVRVEEAVKFLQFFSPGKHRIAFIVFPDDDIRKEYRRSVLKKDEEEPKSFKKRITWDCIEKGEKSFDVKEVFWWGNIIKAKIVEVEIPEELFAKKPQTVFGKALYKWVNRWFETAPRDQCQYRARMIPAFTIQPIFLLIGRSFLLAVSVIGSLYLIVGRSIVAFVGFRPEYMWSGFEDLWRNYFFHGDLSEFNYIDWGICHFDIRGKYYRLWVVNGDRKRDWLGWGDKAWRIWITGLEATVIIGLIFLIAFFWKSIAAVRLLVCAMPLAFFVCIIAFRPLKKKKYLGCDQWEFAFISAVSVVFIWFGFRFYEPVISLAQEHSGFFSYFLLTVLSVVILIFVYQGLKKTEWFQNLVKRTREKRLKKKSVRVDGVEDKMDKADIFSQWLTKELHTSKVPDQVVLDKIPPPPTYRSRVAQRLTIKFWATKAAVCKPFAK